MGRWLSKKEREARDREIVRLRTEHNLTYRQIASQLNVHFSYVERVMKKVMEEAADSSKGGCSAGCPAGESHMPTKECPNCGGSLRFWLTKTLFVIIL